MRLGLRFKVGAPYLGPCLLLPCLGGGFCLVWYMIYTSGRKASRLGAQGLGLDAKQGCWGLHSDLESEGS